MLYFLITQIDPFVLETEDSDDIDEDLDEEIKSFAKETEGKKFLLTRGTLDNEVDDESFCKM